MKVKVLEVKKGHSSLTPIPADVENAIQEWLTDSPNAKIEHVVQTPLADSYGQT
jgi:hypothetical protein